MNTTRSPLWRRITLLGALALVPVVAMAAPARAHNSLVGSTPAAGATVTEQPGVISITTNDDLLLLGGEATGTALQVSGPADAAQPLYYGDGCVTVSGPTASTEVQLGQPGEYTVVWQIVSTDGHPVSDEFTFTWQPDAAQTLAEGSTTAPECASPAGAASEEPSPQVPEIPGSGDADTLWIGGALAAALLAGVVTLLLVRRRPPGPPGSSSPPAPPAG